MKETDLGKILIPWLTDQKWEVFQEVQCQGACCDIVAKRGPLIWAIELKLQLSLDVIGQAERWKSRAHMVSVAVPDNRGRARDAVKYRIMGEWGIGCVMLRQGGLYTEPVIENVRPSFRRRIAASFLLNDAQKTWAMAGTNQGGRWSAFKETCRNVENSVGLNPGLSMKSLVDSTRHHYRSSASARSTLAAWIRGGHIKGVFAFERDGKLEIYPASWRESHPELFENKPCAPAVNVG